MLSSDQPLKEPPQCKHYVITVAGEHGVVIQSSKELDVGIENEEYEVEERLFYIFKSFAGKYSRVLGLMKDREEERVRRRVEGLNRRAEERFRQMEKLEKEEGLGVEEKQKEAEKQEGIQGKKLGDMEKQQEPEDQKQNQLQSQQHKQDHQQNDKFQNQERALSKGFQRIQAILQHNRRLEQLDQKAEHTLQPKPQQLSSQQQGQASTATQTKQEKKRRKRQERKKRKAAQSALLKDQKIQENLPSSTPISTSTQKPSDPDTQKHQLWQLLRKQLKEQKETTQPKSQNQRQSEWKRIRDFKKEDLVAIAETFDSLKKHDFIPSFKETLAMRESKQFLKGRNKITKHKADKPEKVNRFMDMTRREERVEKVFSLSKLGEDRLFPLRKEEELAEKKERLIPDVKKKIEMIERRKAEKNEMQKRKNVEEFVKMKNIERAIEERRKQTGGMQQRPLPEGLFGSPGLSNPFMRLRQKQQYIPSIGSYAKITYQQPIDDFPKQQSKSNFLSMNPFTLSQADFQRKRDIFMKQSQEIAKKEGNKTAQTRRMENIEKMMLFEEMNMMEERKKLGEVDRRGVPIKLKGMQHAEMSLRAYGQPMEKNETAEEKAEREKQQRNSLKIFEEMLARAEPEAKKRRAEGKEPLTREEFLEEVIKSGMFYEPKDKAAKEAREAKEAKEKDAKEASQNRTKNAVKEVDAMMQRMKEKEKKGLIM